MRARFSPAATAFCVLVAIAPAHATWKPQYADAAPAVRAWYESAQLTPAAQKRLGFVSCCAHSDVVHTQSSAARSAAASLKRQRLGVAVSVADDFRGTCRRGQTERESHRWMTMKA